MVFSCRCFSFSFGEEIEYETRIETKSTSIDTFYTACSDLNGCMTDSQASDLQVLAGKSSKLRVFTVAELKLATGNFCASSKIGEGGFGSVYKGVVKSLEYPFDEIQIAVKLANGGVQVRFYLLISWHVNETKELVLYVISRPLNELNEHRWVY
ncbi:putative transferase [Helianthus annuus]|nr:putative transferase [Helianthus annuus]